MRSQLAHRVERLQRTCALLWPLSEPVVPYLIGVLMTPQRSLPRAYRTNSPGVKRLRRASEQISFLRLRVAQA